MSPSQFDFQYAAEALTAELIGRLGDATSLLIVGLVVGLTFGAAAQQSRFCLRSAALSFWHGQWNGSVAVWLLAFAAALTLTQLLVASGQIDTSAVRQLSTSGTLSGAAIGGLMFGVGMIMARGCASRMLVLAACGNLRALVTGLILTLVAQASLRGILSPARLEISSWWLIDAEMRGVSLTLPSAAITLLCVAAMTVAMSIAYANRIGLRAFAAAMSVGLAVAMGWGLNALVASQSFELVPVQSISFTGPSADTLMALVNTTTIEPRFSSGLVPGVFLGALLAASVTGQFRIEGFEVGVSLPRYIAGAFLMGFGSMLAGGCAVGAGLAGGSILALTAWIALLAMWMGAGLAAVFIDRPSREAPTKTQPATPAEGMQTYSPAE